MSIWDGPFASTDLPAAQNFTGWSENTTGAGTLKNRYRDGDALSAFAWREMYGNVNYHVATSRRPMWVESFNGSASADPSKLYTGTSFSSYSAIYAITAAKNVTRNPRRGDNNPPQFTCRVRARKDANATNAVVRIYSCPTLHECAAGWPGTYANAPASSYATWTISSAVYAWTATINITQPRVSERVKPYPVGGGMPDTVQWVTYLMLACQGNTSGPDGTGIYVAQVEVFEEVPGV